MLKNKIKITPFALILSVFNFLFFHYPFFKFVLNNVDYKSFNGVMMIVSLVVLMLILNAWALKLPRKQ